MIKKLKDWELCYKEAGMSPRARDLLAINKAIAQAQLEVLREIESDVFDINVLASEFIHKKIKELQEEG